MRRGGTRPGAGALACLIIAALVALAGALVSPATAQAHAYLTRTAPSASGVLDAPPDTVALTFDEAVEPRLAIISVTNAAATQETASAPRRSPADPDTILVALRPHLPEGWYLVYWRAISIDGHPVQGAYTYAVGPNPGPAPEFRIPILSATAITAPLLAARTATLLSILVAIGLFAMRIALARPALRRRRDGTTSPNPAGPSLRPLTIAFAAAATIGLLATPVYLDVALANDSLRSAFDVANVVPLLRVTAFGRGYEDLWLLFALFTAAAATAIALDRADRPRRSLAELLALTGAVLAAAAALLVPGTIGHAGQTSPRGLSIALDLVHLAAASIWLGGLVGLLVMLLARGARPLLATTVPRFSSAALASVLVLLATGTVATIDHMPALDALWRTGYGRAILVKLGLLAGAAALGAVNLLRSTPAIRSGDPRGPRLLRVTIPAEVAIVAGAVFTAALLSSLPPPPPAFALTDAALARVGPGQVAASIDRAGYRLRVLIAPNRAAAPDSFALELTRAGRPVTGATVALTFAHTEMAMSPQRYSLAEVSPGLYRRAAPALIMVGRWALTFEVSPPGGRPFIALIVDQANG